MKFFILLVRKILNKLRTLNDMTRHRMRIAPNTVTGEQREKKFRRGVLLMGGELVRESSRGEIGPKHRRLKPCLRE